MKRTLLILLITGFGVFATFVDAYWGLLLYSWYSFASPLELTYGVLQGTRLSLLVGFVLVFTTAYQHRKIALLHPVTICMFLFLCAAFFSLASKMEFNFSTIVRNLELLTKLVIISALAPVLLSNLARIRGFVLTIAVSGGLLGFYYGVFGLSAGSKQIFGPGRIGDNNGYAVFLAALLPFVFFSMRHLPINSLKSWRGLISIVLVFGNLLALILTYSRGGFLAGSLVLLLLLSKVRSVMGRILGWGMLLPILVFSSWTIFTADLNVIKIPEGLNEESSSSQILTGYIERLQTLRSELEYESSAGGRMHFWKVAFVMVKENPVFGVGLGQYPHKYKKYDFSAGEFGNIRSAHNTPLLILAELGLFGFLSFVGMLVFMWHSLTKSKLRLYSQRYSPEALEYFSYISMLRISLCGFLLGGMFVNVPFQEIFWALLSISIAIDRSTQQLAASGFVDIADGLSADLPK